MSRDLKGAGIRVFPQSIQLCLGIDFNSHGPLERLYNRSSVGLILSRNQDAAWLNSKRNCCQIPARRGNRDYIVNNAGLPQRGGRRPEGKAVAGIQNADK